MIKVYTDGSCLGNPGNGGWAFLIINKNVIEVIKSITKGNIIDTTGAGDIYAGGFIHGLINNYSLKKCGEIGSICAGQIITQLGSRSNIDFRELIKEI